jgi:DNA polymerase
MRGQAFNSPMAPTVYVTVHPSAILRQPDASQRQEEYRRFVDDLRLMARHLTAKAA